MVSEETIANGFGSTTQLAKSRLGDASKPSLEQKRRLAAHTRGGRAADLTCRPNRAAPQGWIGLLRSHGHPQLVWWLSGRRNAVLEECGIYEAKHRVSRWLTAMYITWQRPVLLHPSRRASALPHLSALQDKLLPRPPCRAPFSISPSAL